MDNASFHKTHVVQAVALDRGLVVAHPPPYSPQYNAIELGFSKLKRLFRQKNQETNDTMSAIRDALDGVTAADSEAFFRHTERAFIFPARV
jgi:transposase